MSKREIYVSVGIALLSFFGAVLGVVIASTLDHKNWKYQFNVEQQSHVLERRVDLIERTAALSGKRGLMNGVQGSLEVEISEMRSRERIEALGRERYELHSEMLSVLAMDALFFGPETKAAIVALNKADPWKAENSLWEALMVAMQSEVQYFPDAL